MNRRHLAIAMGAGCLEMAAYLVWRPAMLRWGTEGDEAVERLVFRARYVEGKHSATRIHPELQDLAVGDQVPYGGGVYATVTELEPNRHLVAGEAFVLRPLPDGRTRVIIRYRGQGYITAAIDGLAADAPTAVRALAFVVRRVPGATLLARGFDFLVADPLHHYMEMGVLRGLKLRAEGRYGDGGAQDRTPTSSVEPMAAAS